MSVVDERPHPKEHNGDLVPIKRKDGSIYKLRGPNPLLADQEIWSKESIVMHNMGNVGRADSEPIPPQPVPKPMPVQEPAPLPALPPEHKVKAPEPKKVEPTIEQKKRTESDEIMFCLPAVMQEQKDPLYGDTYKKVAYREPFRFLARVLQQNDVQFVIFTTDSRVVEHSIVYHPDLRRWWKATEIAETKDGRFVKHFVSDVTPSFAGV